MFALGEVVAREFEIAAQVLGGAFQLAVFLGLVRLPEQRISNAAGLELMQTEDSAGQECAGDGEVPGQTPEPASLVLAGLGLPMIVLIRRRLKKAQADANLA